MLQTAPRDPSDPWGKSAMDRVLAAHATREGHPLAASLTLGGIYIGFIGWTYFAWYRKHKPLADFQWGGDGWVGPETYAGGADKFGHAWATYGLARAGTEMLNKWGGIGRVKSTLIATALSEALFFGVEVKDGFYYEFSFSDLTGDSIGAALAVAMSLSPRLDELFDYRVEYWPSAAYRAQFSHGNVNIAEDYSGETYMLAFHLGGIHSLSDERWGTWSKFVDVAVGYGSRGYKPDPPAGLPDYDHHQNIYFGVSLNAQGLFDYLLEKRAPRVRKATHGFFEMFNVPYTYVKGTVWTQEPTGMVHTGGA
ncbi:MAG TPA: DUF2279 domain-containing protein [Kofleriaceae bacterium]